MAGSYIRPPFFRPGAVHELVSAKPIVLPPFLALRADAGIPVHTGPQGTQGAPKDTSSAAPAGPGSATGTPGTTGDPARPPAGQPQCFDTQTMLMMAAMFAVFYFLLIRPQQKQEKARRELIAKADRGDKVVTTSGIHGVIVSTDKETVTLRVDADVKLRFDRAAIARIVTEPTEAKGDAAAKKS